MIIIYCSKNNKIGLSILLAAFLCIKSSLLPVNLTTIRTHLRLSKVFFFIFSRWMDTLQTKKIYSHVFLLIFSILLVYNVTTIYTHVIFRKVFFWIFNQLMYIWHILLIYCYVCLWIFSWWCDIISYPPDIEEGVLFYL